MGGFEVPLYKILDVDENRIAKPMIPCALEQEMKEQLLANHMMDEKWYNAIAEISMLKMYLKRYKQVKAIPFCEKCRDGIEAYRESFNHELEIQIQEIILRLMIWLF